METNNEKADVTANELAQEIVDLICTKQISYTRAKFALELADNCIKNVAKLELSALPTAKKMTVDGYHVEAELTTKHLLLRINEVVNGITQSCTDVTKGAGIG